MPRHAARTRASRRTAPHAAALDEVVENPDAGGDPEHEALLADALGPALQVVLDTLAPAERLAFVLHDVFAVPFDEIGTILGRSPNAAKQLASRARRRIQGSTPAEAPDVARQRTVVDAFLAASRSGDLDQLLAVLDPDIVLRADTAGVQMGSPDEVRGADAVAAVFSGRALGAQTALVDGIVGMAWAPGGTAKVVWDITVTGDTITGSTWSPTPIISASSTSSCSTEPKRRDRSDDAVAEVVERHQQARLLVGDVEHAVVQQVAEMPMAFDQRDRADGLEPHRQLVLGQEHAAPEREQQAHAVLEHAESPRDEVPTDPCRQHAEHRPLDRRQPARDEHTQGGGEQDLRPPPQEPAAALVGREALHGSPR